MKHTAISVLISVAISTSCVQPPRSSDASLTTLWLQAPKSQGAHWDRLTLLHRMAAVVNLVGMPRAKVLDLFGPPGRADETYPWHTKMDFYRLSAANDQSFRIDYDAGDAVTADSVESAPCHCDFCTSAAPLAKIGSIQNAPTGLTLSGFEALVGLPGKRDVSQNVAGGRVWLNYTETWRVDSLSHPFLIASGHTPLTDAPAFEVSDKLIDDWTLVSFSAACLVQ